MIRKTLTVLGLLLCTVSCTQKPDVMTEAFAQAEAIVNAIKQPVFPDSTFLITDLGAVEGDSTAL